MKLCPRCDQDKPETEFGRNSAANDGLQGYCRACAREYRKSKKQKPANWKRKTADMREYHRAYRKAHPEQMRAYEKLRYGGDPARIKAREREKYRRRMLRLHGELYVVGNPINRKRTVEPETAEARKRRQLRDNAKRAVFIALRARRIERGACFTCGAPNTEGHHPDYSRPLDVVWLCRAHHRQLHAETADSS